MGIHDFNGYSWTQCDDCGAVISGEKPEYVGSHWVKACLNYCPDGCEVFKVRDSTGKVIKYKGKEVVE